MHGAKGGAPTGNQNGMPISTPYRKAHRKCRVSHISEALAGHQHWLGFSFGEACDGQLALALEPGPFLLQDATAWVPRFCLATILLPNCLGPGITRQDQATGEGLNAPTITNQS